MGEGTAACEWVRQGGAIRLVAGAREPEMVVMPNGDPVAIIAADATPAEQQAAFEMLLGRLFLLRYGNAEAREHLRAWVRANPAA